MESRDDLSTLLQYIFVLYMGVLVTLVKHTLILAVLLSVLTLTAGNCCAQTYDPLGTLVWTDYDGSDFKVKFHVFMPSTIRKPDGLKWKGVFSYEGKKLEGGNKFSFFHPCFDHTGVRLFWASGDPILPTATATALELKLTQPKTNIRKWKEDQVFLDRSGSAYNYIFHPVPDHLGKFVYFNKYLAEGDSDAGPGIHIYRADYENGGNERLVVENALYPSVSMNDRRIVFVRQLPNEVKLPETPLAMGVYYVDVDPATGETTMDPELISPPLNEPFDGCVDTGVNTDASWRGPLRCSKAAIGPDERLVIFGLQDARFASKDTTWNLWKIEDLESPSAPTRIGGSEDDAKGWDDFWPSISSDGNWVAHMRHLKTDTRECRIAVTNIDTGDSQQPDDMGKAALWPSFDQDNDVPNLEIRLTPGDSNKPTFIKFTELEPDVWDGSTCKDNFKLYFKGSNFAQDMSTDFEPTTTCELEWTKDDLPAKLHLLISNKTAYEKDKNKVFTSFGTCTGYDTVGSEPIEAMWLEEGERLKIDILARDGRYLRPNTGDMNPEDFKWGARATNYHDRTWETGQSPQVQGRNADPPYFPRAPKSAIDGQYPGVTWWIEDTDGSFVEKTDAAFYHIFRKANYPSPVSGEEAKPYYLRIVAQDLWMNQINILIPIFVWDKRRRVEALQYGTKKNK